ncbi:MAG: TOPRIM nucleotidyl transferase/hydrolase domain-containing protein [Leifsonia sp.]
MDDPAARRFAAGLALAAAARADAIDVEVDGVRRVVLVEGESDRAAVVAFAVRLGRDLAEEGVVVAAMNGATNLPRYLRVLCAPGVALPIAGLCDVQEAGVFRRALEDVGLAGAGDELADLGFFACVRDLEDELLRALGLDEATAVLREGTDGPRFEKMRRQPAQRTRSLADQLHRFIGTAAGRKERVARTFAERIPLERIPAPILDLLAFTATDVDARTGPPAR